MLVLPYTAILLRTVMHGQIALLRYTGFDQSDGNYRKFVGNRAFNIKSKELITSKYVPTRKNPADPRGRGCLAENLTKSCFNRVFWLTNQ